MGGFWLFVDASDSSEFVRAQGACMDKVLSGYEKLFCYWILHGNSVKKEIVPISQVATFVFKALDRKHIACLLHQDHHVLRVSSIPPTEYQNAFRSL